MRFLRSFSVLVWLRVFVLASSNALLMASSFLCIHFWYFSRICFSFLEFFGSMRSKVPVLYSSLGCFMLR